MHNSEYTKNHWIVQLQKSEFYVTHNSVKKEYVYSSRTNCVYNMLKIFCLPYIVKAQLSS